MDQEQLLHLWRGLRDAGTWVLIISVIAEGAIEVAWKEKHATEEAYEFRTRVEKLNDWWRSRRNKFAVAVLFLAALGIAMEMLFGDWADDVVDQMRVRQEKRIADAQIAMNLISGNFEVLDIQDWNRLSKFAGTSFTIRTMDATDAAEQTLAQSIRPLETTAHWKAISEGTLGSPKLQAGVTLKTWSVTSNDAFVQRRNAAAQALRCFFLLEFKIWPKVAQLKMPEDAAVPRDGVYIQIGTLNPREELFGALGKEAMEKRFPDCTQE